MENSNELEYLPTTPSIFLKIWKAKQEIGKVTKGNDNPYFKSKYADLNALLEASEPILLKNDLILLQPIKNGCVCTQIIDIHTGEMVESSMMLPEISDPQKKIASVTYYRRATLQSILSLQAIDDDGNTARAGVDESKKALSQENFERGLHQLEVGEITKDEFLTKCSKFKLTEVQSKAIQLL